MGTMPNRRPHYMVTVHYEEPERGYGLKLFCGCGIEPASGRIVEIFVRPGRAHDGAAATADHRDGLMERLCDDIGRLVSFHLRTGVFAQQLVQRIAPPGSGPGRATFPGHRPGVTLSGLSSPIGAIVTAAALAEEDWRQMHAQLGRDGVAVAHA